MIKKLGTANKPIDTVIFDLDGTLLDTVDDLTDSVNYALEYYNYPTRTKEEVRLAVGNGVFTLMERMLPAGSDIFPVLDKFKEFYVRIKESKTHPYDGIVDLLKKLKEKNIKIGVLSNKFDKGCKLHCKLFFGDLIDFAQGEDEFGGVPRKPSPVGVFKVMEALNSKNCVFVGDSEVDIKTAKNADMPCISVLWGLKTKEFLISKGGDFFVNSPSEILDML